MRSFDYPILIQPAYENGFVVRICEMNGRPAGGQPIICATLDDVCAFVRERLTKPEPEAQD